MALVQEIVEFETEDEALEFVLRDVRGQASGIQPEWHFCEKWHVIRLNVVETSSFFRLFHAVQDIFEKKVIFIDDYRL